MKSSISRQTFEGCFGAYHPAVPTTDGGTVTQVLGQKYNLATLSGLDTCTENNLSKVTRRFYSARFRPRCQEPQL